MAQLKKSVEALMLQVRTLMKRCLLVRSVTDSLRNQTLSVLIVVHYSKMMTKNQLAHLLHVEVAHLVQQEPVHRDHLVEALLVHHAPAVLQVHQEEVHHQVVHQSAAVHQAVDPQAVT